MIAVKDDARQKFLSNDHTGVLVTLCGWGIEGRDMCGTRSDSVGTGDPKGGCENEGHEEQEGKEGEADNGGYEQEEEQSGEDDKPASQPTKKPE